MEWLNYHHLLYFWAVARYGSVVRASAELKLSQPTISGQIRRLEEVPVARDDEVLLRHADDLQLHAAVSGNDVRGVREQASRG